MLLSSPTFLPLMFTNSFNVSVFTARIVQVIYGHFDIVTCITKSENNTNYDCYIVTGSKDCTVMVWQFNARNQAIIGDIGSKYLLLIVYHTVMFQLLTTGTGFVFWFHSKPKKEWLVRNSWQFLSQITINHLKKMYIEQYSPGTEKDLNRYKWMVLITNLLGQNLTLGQTATPAITSKFIHHTMYVWI